MTDTCRTALRVGRDAAVELPGDVQRVHFEVTGRDGSSVAQGSMEAAA